MQLARLRSVGLSVAASLCLSRVLAADHFQQVRCLSVRGASSSSSSSYVQREMATARCDAGRNGRCAALVGARARARCSAANVLTASP